MDIAHALEEISTLEPKQKHQRLKQLAFEIGDNVNSLTLEEIDPALSILNQVIKTVGFPQN